MVRTSDEEMLISVIARQIGVSAETLREWINQTEIDTGEREELCRLRCKNRVPSRRRGYCEKSRPSSPRRTDSGEPSQVGRRGEGRPPRLAAVLRARGSRSGYYAWRAAFRKELEIRRPHLEDPGGL